MCWMGVSVMVLKRISKVAEEASLAVGAKYLSILDIRYWAAVVLSSARLSYLSVEGELDRMITDLR